MDIDQLKSKHPGREFLELTLGDVTVIAVVPTHKEVTQLREMKANGNGGKAGELFVRNCVVDPAGAQFVEVLNRKPFLIEKLGDELAKAAGAEEEVFVKKL